MSEAFHPTNSVAQGSPLFPILYLLVIRSLISLLNISSEVEGISVSGPRGDKNNCRSLKAGAFADDLNRFLRNTDQLAPFRALFAIYENASGAVNSWPKTFGLRVGTLRGSDVLPAGWVEGRDFNTTNTLIEISGCSSAPQQTWQKSGKKKSPVR